MSEKAQHPLGKGLITLMAVASGATVANLYYNQPLLGEMARSLGATEQQIGVVPTLTQVGYALGLLFLVPMGDRLERRRLIFIMSLLLSAGLVAAAFAPSVACLALASLWVGCLSTIAQQIVPFAAQLAEPERRGKAVGTVMSGLLIGILLARTVSGAVGSVASWRAMFGIAAAGMLLLAVILAKRLPVSQPTVTIGFAQIMASLAQLMKTQPVLREAAWIGGLHFGAFSVFWSTLALLLESSAFHLGAGAAGLFGLAGVAGAMAAPLAGKIADRGGPRKMVVIGALAVLVSFGVFAVSGHTIAGLVAGVLLMDFGVQGAHIANMSRIFALNPEARSRLNSCYMVSYFIGGASGSLIGSAAWAHWGWTGVTTAGGIMAACALLKLLLAKKEQPSSAKGSIAA